MAFYGTVDTGEVHQSLHEVV